MTLLSCPHELQLKICQLACLDDGSTGRALSGVCNHIRAISFEFRYQSIALSGVRQINAFAEHIEHLYQSGKSPVKHLFITDIRTATESEGAPLSENGFIANTRAVVALLGPSLITLTLAPSQYIYHHLNEDGNCTRHTAADILQDLCLPMLMELSLCREYDMPRSTSFAPNLRMLQIAEDSWLELRYTPLCTYYPALERYCGPLNYQIISTFRSRYQPFGSNPPCHAVFRCLHLPSSEASSYRMQMLDENTQDYQYCQYLQASSHGLFTLLVSKVFEGVDHEILNLRQHWLDRLARERGCWKYV